MKRIIRLSHFIFIFTGLLLSCTTFAAVHQVDLKVENKYVKFTSRISQAIAVNGQIPGPTLHFKQGDHVKIRVHNLLQQETAMHWHGLLIPWQMDGVMGVTQKGIPPGGFFDYEFSLEQAGTYWYHAHAGLQEQQGLYGAIIIDPIKPVAYHYDRDEVIVLSDWSNTHPEHILANLKKDGDYYSPRFPLQASLFKFLRDYLRGDAEVRKNLISDYHMMQQMRMGIYDFSDVAYDAFLLNGKTKNAPWTRLVKPGDQVRLRFIGAGASTIFNVKIPGTKMQVVQVQGNDVAPYFVDTFKIAPGETYEVLVRVAENHPYIIYAESIDTLGAAVGALITQNNQHVDYSQVTPFPEPVPVMREMMALMMSKQNSSMDIGHMKHMKMDHMNMDHMNMDHMNMDQMDMGHMSMQTEASIKGDSIVPFTLQQPKTVGTKYQDLRASVKTNNPNKAPDDVIKMELFGYMGRYLWFINGVPEYLAKPIPLNPNKRYRFVFTNPTMMRHPMHLHGHWFILRNGHGAYDPLLHTIDLAPGATVTADVDTDASGQWLFHCHLLYHMMSGMTRVFQYSTLMEITEGKAKPEHVIEQTKYVNRPIVRVDKMPIDKMMVHHPHAHEMSIYKATFIEGGTDPFHNVQKLTVKGLYGRDYQKLQLFINDAEMDHGKIANADIDIFYWRLISQFWVIKGGANYFYRPAQEPYWQPGLGIEGLMPYFIEADLRSYYYAGSLKLDAQFTRDTQISNNWFVKTGVRGIFASQTEVKAQLGTGLNQVRLTVKPYYRLMPGMSVFVEYEHEQDYGAFKRLQLLEQDATTQDTVTLGLSLII